MSKKPISPLRRRMIEDMSVRNFAAKTQSEYVSARLRSWRIFSAGRPPGQGLKTCGASNCI